ncbi:MAG: single-stranded DNA-binding protein [Spirochaetaceae bacterium]|nr:single-stranded DNA-binding protein [Spirochaetaceae bacterium]
MASMDINHVIEIGNLTRDEEVNYTPGGMAVGKFSIAVNRRVKKGQEYVDEVNYFDVSIFGKQAESLKPYLTKGKKVAIDGFLKQDRWEKDGQKHSAVKIIANDIQLLGGRDSGSQNNGGYQDAGYDPDGYGYN